MIKVKLFWELVEKEKKETKKGSSYYLCKFKDEGNVYPVRFLSFKDIEDDINFVELYASVNVKNGTWYLNLIHRGNALSWKAKKVK